MENLTVAEAIEFIKSQGYAVKVWTEQDIVDAIELYSEYTEGVEDKTARVEEIVAKVKKTREWASLSAGCHHHWHTLDEAVSKVLVSM